VLREVLGEAARRFGETPAYVASGGWPVTYAALDRASDEVAVGLARRGVGTGDVVALVLPACPEYFVAYLAAAKVGAVTAGVNPRLSAPEREGVLTVAGPKLVLATADLAPASWPVEEVAPAPSADAMLHSLRTPGDAPPALPDDPERPVAIIFTSGTTGAPKGALFCNRQLSAIVAIDVGDRWGGGASQLAGTALAHLGPMTKLPGNLRQGATAYLTARWRAEDALRMTSELKMTSIGGIPTQVALMLRVPDFDRYDLSSLRAIVIGGGPATPSLVREARQRFGVPVSSRYSCTEAAIGIGTGLGDPPEDAEESVGKPLAGVELFLLDDDDRPVRAGETGQVCLKSPAVMSGYYRDPAATAAAFTAQGAVRTGDLGWLDDRGRLHLAGRSKEMYVRGGYNVHPLEVESVLSEHPGVAAVAVAPRPDDVMGEVGVAFVVTRSGATSPSLDELRSFGGGRLAGYKLPDELRLVDELPLTAMDKLDRRALRAQLAG
jgi:acyl-CoA synthetase (AMP-forming)/AMP-acid ligase II